jgi:thioredoxin:protein disulfide reductase
MFQRFLLLVVIYVTSFSIQAAAPIIPEIEAFQWEIISQNSKQFTVHFSIQEGTFLYQDQVHLTTSDTPLEAHLPDGITHLDPAGGETTKIYRQKLDIPVTHHSLKDFEMILEYQGCTDSGFCYPPVRESVWMTISDPPNMITLFKKSFLWIGLSFFGMGLLLAFTPCVLPMLPILAGILSGPEVLSSRKAFSLSLVYVLAMAITYAIAGVLAADLGYTLQGTFQTPWILFTFAAFLILLALKQLGWVSFGQTGFLENLGTFIHNKLPQGTYLGAAGMGILATLIASPCVTVPMIGTLTYITQTGDMILGGFALWMMGLGLGAPLLVLGTLGGRYIPKAGPWMETVQRLFALVLIGLGIWLVDRVISLPAVYGLWGLWALFGAYLLRAFHLSEKGLPPRLGMLLLVLAAFSFWQMINSTHEIMIKEQSIYAAPHVIKEIKSQAPMGVLLDFDASWCITCRALKKTVLPILQEAGQWEIRVIDMSERTPEIQTLMAQYQVVAPPTFIFLNLEGKEIARLAGGEEIILQNINKISRMLDN